MTLYADRSTLVRCRLRGADPSDGEELRAPLLDGSELTASRSRARSSRGPGPAGSAGPTASCAAPIVLGLDGPVALLSLRPAEIRQGDAAEAMGFPVLWAASGYPPSMTDHEHDPTQHQPAESARPTVGHRDAPDTLRTEPEDERRPKAPPDDSPDSPRPTESPAPRE